MEGITTVVLGLIVISQLVERYLYAKDMNQKLQDCVKAVMSRNINEYITATTTDKITKEPLPEPDEVELNSQTDDDTFNKFIKASKQL